MGRRLYAMDPATGTMHYVDYNEVDDSFTLVEEADCSALLERNQRFYNDAPARFGEFADVASIHMVVRSRLMREGIIRTHTDNDPEPYRRWLNDPDNRKWRTRPGKV